VSKLPSDHLISIFYNDPTGHLYCYVVKRHAGADGYWAIRLGRRVVYWNHIRCDGVDGPLERVRMRLYDDGFVSDPIAETRPEKCAEGGEHIPGTDGSHPSPVYMRWALIARAKKEKPEREELSAAPSQ